MSINTRISCIFCVGASLLHRVCHSWGCVVSGWTQTQELSKLHKTKSKETKLGSGG